MYYDAFFPPSFFPNAFYPPGELSGGGPAPEPPVDPPAPPPIISSPLGGPAEMDEYGSWKWPEDVYPQSYTLLLQSHTLRQQSPLTRKRRMVRLVGGDRLIYEMTLVHNRVRNQRTEALLARLKGPIGTVALWDFDRERPLGPAQDWSHIGRTRFDDETQFMDGTRFGPGAAGYRVYGNWRKGDEEIVIIGFPQYTTQLVGADQIGINGRIYRLNRDATSDGLGKARAYLHRGLLADVAHNTPVVTYRPTSPFYLVDDDQVARSRHAHGLPTITLRFEEAL